MPFATTSDSVRLHYHVMGDGDPLLLIAGQGYDRTLWSEIQQDLSDRHLTISYDHRGTGLSDKPRQPPYSTRGFAMDAIAILDELGIEQAHVYGVSMGGRIAQWLGIDHASRIGCLILGCTTPGNAHGVPRPKEIDRIMQSGQQQKMLELLVSPSWLAAHPAFLAQRMASTPIPTYAQQLHYQASEQHDAWELLPEISAPTLIIHGSEDRINLAANAALLAQRIAHAELHIIEGARHGYFWEYRELSNELVGRHLRRHPLTRR